MDDRLDHARQRGDSPRAPVFIAWPVVAGGLLGAVGAAALAPWRALAEAGFGLEARAPGLVGAVVGPVVLGGAVGALGGAALGHLVLDRFSPALRLRIHRDGTRRTGLGALVLLLAGLAPLWLAAPGGRDPGSLLRDAPLVALAAALTLALPLALLDRARGRARWRARVAPDPPPRHRPDEVPPEVRAAVVDRARQGEALGDCCLISGPYAVAVALDPARLVAHGGDALAQAHRQAGRPVIPAPELAAALAGVPTGDALPDRWILAVQVALKGRGHEAPGPL